MARPAWYELIARDVETEIETEEDREQSEIIAHVKSCTKDGFCYVCQCL